MSFIERLPQHLKDMEATIAYLQREREKIDWGTAGHECDCEYCYRQGYGEKAGDPDAEEKDADIEAAIKDSERVVESLKRYAELMGVKVKDAIHS